MFYYSAQQWRVLFCARPVRLNLLGKSDPTVCLVYLKTERIGCFIFSQDFFFIFPFIGQWKKEKKTKKHAACVRRPESFNPLHHLNKHPGCILVALSFSTGCPRSGKHFCMHVFTQNFVKAGGRAGKPSQANWEGWISGKQGLVPFHSLYSKSMSSWAWIENVHAWHQMWPSLSQITQ